MFEVDELVNEAWIAIHELDEIRYVSQSIRWAMINYMRSQWQQKHRGKKSVKISTVDKEIAEGIFLRDTIIAQKSERKKNFEDKDYVYFFVKKGNLTLAEWSLIYQRYYQGLTIKRIAEINKCSAPTIHEKLGNILNKLKRLTGAALSRMIG